MTNPRLYNHDLNDDCYRVRLMAALAGVALDICPVDMFPGNEHRSPEFVALNPLARLPLMHADGMILRQTEAMLLYLAAVGPHGPVFLPKDPATYALMQDWLVFAARDLGVVSQARAVAMLGAEGDGVELALMARRGLRMLEDHMTEQRHKGMDFVVGAHPSVADIALFPAFALCRDFNLDHDAFPSLRRWARQIRQLLGFISMPGIPDYH